ncbi:MAG: adenosylcobinamide-phosphate synthase CbiB [Proteobacteria bacterium]|nr:adenosylcobinamide-phosphate synthase CbiB [Pseudomonadota bacterium]MBU1687715.1 adenosylcobinamide-phosphate synthase CbiB [Pseudomonadota bacterium]
MSLVEIILAALLLDLVIGDPRWLPHPVRGMGWLALRAEDLFRRWIPSPAWAGVMSVLLVLAFIGGVTGGVMQAVSLFHHLAGEGVAVIIIATGLALRDLIRHSNDVRHALEAGDLPEARHRVGMIVGRDSACLDQAGIVRACIESVAENSVDGVIAPLFYATLGGMLGPGLGGNAALGAAVSIMLYKAINTMDSTFGYKNERYLHFGRAAARLDDLANFIPARLGGLLMVAAAFLSGLEGRDAWRIFRRDRLRHASPNSGHTEAAMAGALGLELGGPSSYFGKVVEKPWLGFPLKPATPVAIARANRLLVATTVLAVILLMGLAVGG